MTPNPFNLPDLGEGLTEAILRSWHVKAGDKIKKDTVICTVETDKSLVDIPALEDCAVIQLCINENQRIAVGEPLCQLHYPDSVSLVGKLSEAIKSQVAQPTFLNLKIHPEALNLAKSHHLSEAVLQSLVPTGQLIRPADIQNYLWANSSSTMAKIATESLQRPTSTIIDHCPIYSTHQISAISISAIYQSLQIHLPLKLSTISMAVDDQARTHIISAEFSEHIDKNQATLNDIKAAIILGKIPQAWLKKSDVLISNFGSIAGRYGMPILPPETKVAIGIGRSFIENTQAVLPLTMVFDHSIFTGGQMARLLKTIMDTLSEQSQHVCLG